MKKTWKLILNAAFWYVIAFYALPVLWPFLREATGFWVFFGTVLGLIGVLYALMLTYKYGIILLYKMGAVDCTAAADVSFEALKEYYAMKRLPIPEHELERFR